jgi:hypothetical protein
MIRPLYPGSLLWSGNLQHSVTDGRRLASKRIEVSLDFDDELRRYAFSA